MTVPVPALRRARVASLFDAVKYPAALFLILTGVYWKLVLTQQFDWIWGPDLSGQVLPWLEEQSRQVHEQRFPLWDPNMWAGQPLVGQAQPGTAYPLNWLLFAMPRTAGHISMTALAWYYVVIHFMAALFAYLLCRDLGRSRAASLIGGLIFALSGYFGSVGWPQIVNGALWAPLVFLFLFRTVRGVRPYAGAAWCGAAMGLSWLSGHHQAPVFMMLACGGVWLFYFIRSGRPDWRIARLAVLALAIAGLTGAMQIVPSFEYGRLAQRWAGAARPLGWNDRVPYYVAGPLSLSPAHLPGIVLPRVRGFVDPYLGVTAFTLALLGVALCWRERAVRLLCALGLGALLFALGVYNVFHGFVYTVVPMVEKARAPSMALFILACAAGALAAFAVDAAASAPSEAWLRRASRACFAFGVGLLVVIAAIVQFGGRGAVEQYMFVPAVTAVLLAALLYGWRSGALGRRQFVCLLAGLVLLDLGTSMSSEFADRNDKARRIPLQKITGNEDIAAFLSAQPPLFRIDTGTAGDLGMNWGEYHNFGFMRGYTPSVTVNMEPLELHTRQTRRLFNVRYTVARSAPSPEMKEVFRGEGGINVYEDAAAFPRAWTVHELATIADADQGRAYIYDHVEALRHKAFLYGAAPALEACGGDDRVRLDTYTPSRVVFRAAMNCRGMLVLSDTAYPGWRAYVDGRRVPIHEVNFSMRGVVLPAGTHEVKFSYRPVAVYVGAGLTLLGLIAATIIGARAGKRGS